VAELLRKSRRLWGQPPEEVPSHHEGLKVLVTPRDSRVGSPEEGESSDIGEEPEIYEPESEFAATPTSGFVSPTSSGPGSPRVERVITQDLPSGLIAIEELAPEEVGIPIPENQPVIELRERESIFYSPPRSSSWYLSLTNLLENSGLSFSPPHAPYHPTPRGFYTPVNMSGQSSMLTQSLESFLYGGPSVPSGYQSLSGTFSGASPQPIEQGLLTGNNGTKPLSVEDILMMSGSIPNPQPQGGQLPPRGQTQLTPGGQPQGTQFASGGQPQGQYIPMG